MLAGEVANVSMLCIQGIHILMGFCILCQERGNSLQISHGVRPGPCAVSCVCAPVVITGQVAVLKINILGIN